MPTHPHTCLNHTPPHIPYTHAIHTISPPHTHLPPPQGNSNIRTLNLSGNNIGDDGAVALAAMLERNTTLETLELNSNAIDLKGITALARALGNNTSLKVLGLRWECGECVCMVMCV